MSSHPVAAQAAILGTGAKIFQNVFELMTMNNVNTLTRPVEPNNVCYVLLHLDQARGTMLKKVRGSTETELHRFEQAILDKAFKGKL